MKFKIPRCYDSHVHFLPTGEYLSILNIREIRTLSELANLLKTAPRESFRGEFLVGFGWGDELEAELKLQYGGEPKAFLDSLQLPFGIVLSRRDGHASWVNSRVLADLGWQKVSDAPLELRSQLGKDQSGNCNGLLLEKAHFIQLERFPPVSREDRELYILKAQELFLKEGFTHIREMMASEELFEDLVRLDLEKKMQLYIELNYSVQRLDELEATLGIFQKHKKSAPFRLRPQGLKVFMDGALGSEGAFLSYPYEGGHGTGQLLWTEEETETLLRRSWQLGVPLALHCIGDASLDQVLRVAQKIRATGLTGHLSLEHAEVVHPDSFAKMRDLSIDFHFQPSHYLGDSEWLSKKLGERFAWCFPWKWVEEMGFPIYFGSDSPIVEPSLKKTLAGLRQSAADGIPACDIDWKFAHSHPDKNWGKKVFTEVTDSGEVLRIEGL